MLGFCDVTKLNVSYERHQSHHKVTFTHPCEILQVGQKLGDVVTTLRAELTANSECYSVIKGPAASLTAK